MTLPSRNWTLIDIFRSDARCDQCGAKLKWVFLLAQGRDMACAGSECVKAMTHTCDPVAAMRALQGKWKQHRSYYYKRIKHRTWCIGKRRKTDHWWISHGRTVGTKNRSFMESTYATFDDAKLAAVKAAVSGVWQ